MNAADERLRASFIEAFASEMAAEGGEPAAHHDALHEVMMNDTGEEPTDADLALFDRVYRENVAPADACPGCGCRPGAGVTEGCNDPGGCGTVRGWAV